MGFVDSKVLAECSNVDLLQDCLFKDLKSSLELANLDLTLFCFLYARIG
jgi:hypothetical protein